MRDEDRHWSLITIGDGEQFAIIIYGKIFTNKDFYLVSVIINSIELLFLLGKISFKLK
jgi:hypothetical protein